MPKKNIDENHLDILKIITEAGGQIENRTITNKSRFEKIKTEYYLENLENGGYINLEYEPRVAGEVYRLTTKGKKIVVEQGIAK
jgi:uncharacterized membrane protein